MPGAVGDPAWHEEGGSVCGKHARGMRVPLRAQAEDGRKRGRERSYPRRVGGSPPPDTGGQVHVGTRVGGTPCTEGGTGATLGGNQGGCTGHAANQQASG